MHYCRGFVAFVIAVAIAWTPGWARKEYGSVPDGYHDQILEMALEENIATPEIHRKYEPAIVSYQKSVAIGLKQQGIGVETMRDGLVVVATLHASEMFAPNDTLLLPGAGIKLRHFTGMLTQPDLYKMIIAVHSDDTGSEEYVNALTEARAEAVYGWFEAKGLDVAAVVPYGLGADDPLKANNSRANRDTNRRVEIYLVPGPVMLELVKAGKLK
ncbi:MAG: OmpA family protein [Muribaculaceae bacterium]|nr:OmpA family protein [Muribaculaceae bacterium]